MHREPYRQVLRNIRFVGYGDYIFLRFLPWCILTETLYAEPHPAKYGECHPLTPYVVMMVPPGCKETNRN